MAKKKLMKEEMDKYGITGNTGLGVGGLFHISAPYSIGITDKVFVEHRYRNNGTGDTWDSWKRMTLIRAYKENKRIITCSRCARPAVSLDHHWPHMNDYNVCAVHHAKDVKKYSENTKLRKIRGKQQKRSTEK